jgi:Domain of unknown function (DUF4129)
MLLRRKILVVLSLFLRLACVAETNPTQVSAEASAFTPPEYAAELERLASTIQQMSHAEDPPSLLKGIPPVWRIKTAQKTFEVPTEGLRANLAEWQKKPDKDLQGRIVANLHTLRSEALSFEASPADNSQRQNLLKGILANNEFQHVEGQTWLDRLKQRLVEQLVKLLGRAFSSSAISTISDVLVYGLIAAAVLVVLYWMYRTIRDSVDLEELALKTPTVSSKAWTVWMAEARAAADAGNWRDAIHLGYWCGISFLEGQGLWRPDTARTPREYLRLLPSVDANHEALGALTRSFEVVWYGTQDASSRSFSETLAQLEKLGCRSN